MARQLSASASRFTRSRAAVYRPDCTAWLPDRFEEGVGPAGVHGGPVVDEDVKLMLFIIKEHEEVSWGDVRRLGHRD